MFNEIFKDKNQKRRKGSMLKNGFGAIMYFLVLLFLLVVPIKALGGVNNTFVDTDSPGFQLYYFWDSRDRQSFFQVTNTSNSPITVHVQIFNVPDDPNCFEIDFDDTYTGLDTHVYDLSNLVLNDTTVVGPAFPEGGYGFVVVSVVDGSGDADSGQSVIIGNFRVIDDDAGYEYRTNAAGFIEAVANELTFNFNDVEGAISSDVVGIMVANAGDGPSEVLAGGDDITAEFDPTIFNDAEKDFSCPDMVFACTPSDGDAVPFIQEDEDVGLVGFDLGINDELVNSKGEPNICGGTLSTGYVEMDISDFDGEGQRFFVGFIGLNNGDGTGSMDTWWASGQEEEL